MRASADGDERISGEIAIDLEREEHDRDEERERAIAIGKIEHRRHIGREIVGDHHFQEISRDRELEPEEEIGPAEMLRARDLRQEPARPHDRPRDELREERDEGGEGQEIALGRDALPVHVDRVAHALKRVERDAGRQHDVEARPVGLHAEALQRARDARLKKIAIFEEAEIGEVGRDAERDEDAPPPQVFRRPDEPAERVVHDRRGREQEGEAPIPPAIEEIAGRERDEPLPAPAREEEHGQENRGKNEENEARKDHGARACGACGG